MDAQQTSSKRQQRKAAALADVKPLLHSVDAAAVRIGVGRTTIYALLAAGELKAVRIGARTLIADSELQRFIADRQVQQ